ncbi:hypothetical protein HW555_000819 [Spodoptera exigua]|uniref:HTH psq-type domain-containing protein n=1 Tax=Spodoptera exigua TaxID=7107 RepID=A0A835LB49_SPOEX|nr:hypothetical protein HW555_000819 [Spodoptera exigua]
MEILRKLDSGENQMKLAGEYGVGRATIYDIKKNREKIENFANTADAGTSSRQTVKIGEYPVMEDALYTWFLQERARHTPLTGDIIQLKQMLFQKNQTELTEQDVEEWFAENSDSFPAMTDEEIINDAVSSSEQDDLEMTLLSPTSPSVKAEDGLKSIDVSIRWAEENNASNDILLNLRKLREMIIKKIYYGKKQVKIDNYLVKASSSSSAAENVTNDEPNM